MLDGAVVAAAITGARQVIVVAHPAVTGILHAAAADRRALGLDPVRLFVQSTPLTASSQARPRRSELGGARAPGTDGDTAATRRAGLHGRPTLVQNAETLAHLALIVRYGASWFRALGTAGEPGSVLVTVIGAVREPGVTRSGSAAGGRRARAAQAVRPAAERVLLGGYFGTWVRWPLAGDLPFSAAGLAAVHAAPGAGLVAALPPAPAASRRQPASRAIWPTSRPASAGRACSAWRDRAELGALAAGRRASVTTDCAAGSARSMAAAPAAIPTARYA